MPAVKVTDWVFPGATGLVAEAICAPLNAMFVLPSALSVVIAQLCETVPTLWRVTV